MNWYTSDSRPVSCYIALWSLLKFWGTNAHCKKHLVKITMRLLQFQGPLCRWLKKSKTQLSSINSSTIHHASRDTSLLANKYQLICIHLLAIIQFLTEKLPMNLYGLACWQVSVLALWSLIELWGGWQMILVFLNILHTCSMKPETACSNHALVVILTKYFLQWSVVVSSCQ